MAAPRLTPSTARSATRAPWATLCWARPWARRPVSYTHLFLARGETCPAAAELLGRLAAEADTPRSRAASQLAFALLCELAGADSAAPPLPPLVEAAIEDIRQNYAGLYGVEELSERLGVSKSHLVRTFTAAVGVPPGRYLTTVRVEAAMRLLLHREYTLDVIASLCGFSGAN